MLFKLLNKDFTQQFYVRLSDYSPLNALGLECATVECAYGPEGSIRLVYGIVSLPSAEPCSETDLPAMVREVLIWMA